MKAILIPAEEFLPIRLVEIPLDEGGPLRNTESQLEAMRNALGVQYVDFAHCSLTMYYGVGLVCGDESRLDGSRLNLRASELYAPGLFGDVLAVHRRHEFMNGWPEEEAEAMLQVILRVTQP